MALKKKAVKKQSVAKSKTKLVKAKAEPQVAQGGFHLTKDVVMKILLVLPVLAFLLSTFLQVSAMGSIALFLAFPALLLTLVHPQSVAKSALFSLVTIPTMFVVDFVSHLMAERIVPVSVMPRILGIVPVEDLVGIFFLTYAVIMFYEYFLDRQNIREVFQKRFIALFAIFSGVPLLYLVVGYFMPQVLTLTNFYLYWGGLGLLLPTVLFLVKFPALRGKFSITAAYFFFLTLMYEISALARSWWIFPNQTEYLGKISMLGVSFPIEEFVFLFLFFAAGMLAWYEFFDDDQE
jgi:hypothetical protein